jgi:hypothetical protein
VILTVFAATLSECWRDELLTDSILESGRRAENLGMVRARTIEESSIIAREAEPLVLGKVRILRHPIVSFLSETRRAELGTAFHSRRTKEEHERIYK